IQIWRVVGLMGGDSLQAWDAEGKPQTAPLPVRALSGTASDQMALWAQHYTPDGPVPDERACCPLAIPYLAMKDPKEKRNAAMTRLDKGLIGGPLVNVHGLSVHATWTPLAGEAFSMAAWGCVGTWNTSRASAHFGIAADGTVIQFVLATYAAYAQGNPGDFHWLSV